MLDLPLSNLMCRVLLNEDETFTFRDLFQLDSQLARSLQQLHQFAANDEADNVEELYLDFNLPGYQNIELLKARIRIVLSGLCTLIRTIFGRAEVFG
jgi:hypothetical protein